MLEPMDHAAPTTRQIAMLAWLLVSMVVVGCGPPPQPPLMVGVSPWVGYDPLVLARERGLLDPAQVRIVELMSGSESQRALRNGLLDAAGLTLDAVLRLADAGVELKIVAVLSDSVGGDAVLAASGIGDPTQLRGKRIAVEETAVGALLLDRVLSAGGLDQADVQVQLAEATRHEDLLIRGRVDAVVTYEPMQRRLRLGGYRVIFDSRSLPGEIVDVLVVRADVTEDRIAPLLAAWEAGQADLVADPEGAAALLAPGTGLDVTEYLATLEGLRFLTSTDGRARLAVGTEDGLPVLARDASGLVATLQRLGLLRAPPDWSTLVIQPAGLPQ